MAKALKDHKFDRAEAAAALTVSQRDLHRLIVDLEKLGFKFEGAPADFSTGVLKKARIVETKLGASLEKIDLVSKTVAPEPEGPGTRSLSPISLPLSPPQTYYRSFPYLLSPPLHSLYHALSFSPHPFFPFSLLNLIRC